MPIKKGTIVQQENLLLFKLLKMETHFTVDDHYLRGILKENFLL